MLVSEYAAQRERRRRDADHGCERGREDEQDASPVVRGVAPAGQHRDREAGVRGRVSQRSLARGHREVGAAAPSSSHSSGSVAARRAGA